MNGEQVKVVCLGPGTGRLMTCYIGLSMISASAYLLRAFQESAKCMAICSITSLLYERKLVLMFTML